LETSANGKTSRWRFCFLWAKSVKSLLSRYLDDLLFLLGALLICIGTYALCPAATWFVAGAFCIVAGMLVGALIGKAKADHVAK
jgi:uncharacterized membrane protein SirB2